LFDDELYLVLMKLFPGVIPLLLSVAIGFIPAYWQELRSDDPLLRGLGITRIEQTPDGSYRFKTVLQGFEDLKVTGYAPEGTAGRQTRIVLQAPNGRVFGFTHGRVAGDSNTYFFVAGSRADFESRKGSFSSRPARNAFSYGKSVVRTEEAMAYGIGRLMPWVQKAALPLTLEPNLGYDFRIECYGKDVIETADACRNEAIRTCQERSKVAVDISTCIVPDDKGGYTGVTICTCREEPK